MRSPALSTTLPRTLGILGLLSLTAIATATATGCAKPEPPVLTTKDAKVVSVDPAGLQILIHVEAYNPNKIELSAESAQGQVLLDDKMDMGSVVIPTPITLPAQARTVIDVPLAMKWANVATLGLMAAQNRAIPYTVHGSVKVGGGRLSATVPFVAKGTITHDQLLGAARNSLPKGLQNFGLPTQLPQ